MSDQLSAAKQALLQARLSRTATKSQATIPVISTPATSGQQFKGPLSLAQQRMWLLNELEPHSNAYTVCNATRYVGPLSIEALCRAFVLLCQRHAILRTRFDLTQDGPQQVVLPEARPDIRHVDLGDLDSQRRADALEALLAEHAGMVFDLADAAPIRFTVVRCGTDEHVVVVALHHILYDAWSDSIFTRDLSALYEACRTSRPSPLEPLPIQYADYAHWQRRTSQPKTAVALDDYWRKRIEGAPTLLTLPSDRPRPRVATHAGAAWDFALPPDVSTALSELCRNAQTTLFMALTAALSVLLGRHASQQEVCIGTPIANRRLPELESLIGLFLNTLVVRTRIDPAESFSELLARVRSDVLDDFAHDEMPFERLIDIAGESRQGSHSPLFQALLVVQNAPTRRPEGAGLRVEPVGRPVTSSKFDLTLYVVEHPGVIHASFEYSTELFDQSTIARLGQHLVTLLTAVVADPARTIGDIELMSTQERAVLEGFNANTRAHEGAHFVHVLFEQQAAARPAAIALSANGQSVSYGALNERANRLAHQLLELGLMRDGIVAVCAERSVEMVVGLLAVLKAGGAYVPLDPQLPYRRIEAMLQDCAPHAILSQRQLIARLPATDARILPLEADDGTCSVDPDPSALGLQPSHLAYVMYTSGSTGLPKGVMIQHDALINRLRWAERTFAVDACDRILQKTPYAFDVSVWEFFLPLMTGATLVLARPGGHQDPAYLAETIRAERVTIAHFVPSMLQVFVDLAPAQACTSLRHVLCSGEALPRALQDHFIDWLPSAALHNLYGPTEATVDVTHWRCLPSEPPGPVPIGHAIANTQLHVIDERGHRVPRGVVGELAIGGIQVARGYLNRPELTAERFVPDRFSSDPIARLYRTGDLARYRPDGAIEYCGRNDFQVKLRGFRIELGEIEGALNLDPHIRESTVIARKSDNGDTTLVAYVVADPTTVHAASLRRFLGQRLPEYMVPADFVVLDSMPLTANGKLDRAGLAAMEPACARHALRVAAPGTLEAEICAMCAQVLARDSVGPDSSFLELGGHSLAAVRLRHAINKRYGTSLSMRAIFEAGALADVAREVAAQRDAGSASAVLDPALHANEVPASKKQLADWVANQVALATGQQSFCVQRELTLHAIDSMAVHRALSFMVRRYEILRTVLNLKHGQLTQTILQDFDDSALLKRIDLRATPDLDGELGKLRHAEATQTFDFARWPLFSAVLAHTPLGDTFLFTIDHVCMDQQFFAMLIDEFTAAYLSFSEGAPLNLPEVTSTYQDYARFEALELGGAAGLGHAHYWRRLMNAISPGQDASFSDWPPASAPPDYRTSMQRQFHRIGPSLDPTVKLLADGAVLNVAPERVHSAGYIFRTPETLFSSLKSTAAANGVALSTVIVTAVLLLTARLAARDRAALVMLADTRSHGEWLSVGGCFINEMLVAVTLVEADTGIDLMKKVQRQLLDSDEHKIYPFAKLLADCNVSVEQLGTPFLNYISSQSEEDLEAFSPYHVGESFTGMALSVNVSAFRNSFRIALHYETRRFKPETVESIAGQFTHVLQWLCSSAQTPLQTVLPATIPRLNASL